jgi:hypothetical protein
MPGSPSIASAARPSRDRGRNRPRARRREPIGRVVAMYLLGAWLPCWTQHEAGARGGERPDGGAPSLPLVDADRADERPVISDVVIGFSHREMVGRRNR